MRRSSWHPEMDDAAINVRTLKTLIPYLLDYKGRIALALCCLVAAKLASVGLPFILKHIVDGMDTAVSTVVALPLCCWPTARCVLPTCCLAKFAMPSLAG